MTAYAGRGEVNSSWEVDIPRVTSYNTYIHVPPDSAQVELAYAISPVQNTCDLDFQAHAPLEVILAPLEAVHNLPM